MMIWNEKSGSLGKTITFVCEFINCSSTIRGPSLIFDIESKLKELSYFEELLNDKKFSDFVITVEGKNFHVHKSILATKSPVFKAMFILDMKENRQGSVVINGITHGVMRELLRFIYCGKVENQDVTMELYVAADKYLVDGLKVICERRLFKNINLNNVFEYLNFVNSHDIPKLRHYCEKYFKTNLKDIVARWPNFKLSELNNNIVDEVWRILTDTSRG
ncbi:hypothetical protein QAD02_009978 [Eretmocerus hayati]|uniref:Uncharacterized protein n=1 Tax=Eretmocerus hayati TaxID=131215 RepID=A0ACC2NAZ2_9HYME|nr:hypothetical protein QAD02_009978 [Eretmocerus hayati]